MPAMLQDLREVIPPFSVLAATLSLALDGTRDVQQLQFLLASHDAGGLALADGHP